MKFEDLKVGKLYVSIIQKTPEKVYLYLGAGENELHRFLISKKEYWYSEAYIRDCPKLLTTELINET